AHHHGYGAPGGYGLAVGHVPHGHQPGRRISHRRHDAGGRRRQQRHRPGGLHRDPGAPRHARARRRRHRRPPAAAARADDGHYHHRRHDSHGAGAGARHGIARSFGDYGHRRLDGVDGADAVR